MGKFHDLLGRRFERLLVLERAQNKGKHVMWKCQCDCGKIIYVSTSNLIYGHTKSCGCYSRQRSSEGNSDNLLGQRFGMLVVTAKARNKGEHTAWQCHCDCGNDKIILSNSLKRGLSTSCGCQLRAGNEIYIIGDVAICLITGRKRSGYFWFDAEDIELVEKHQWYIDAFDRARTFENGRHPHFYRILLGIVGDASVVVDHVNGDERDNRKCNLRICTQADNMKHHVCGVRGVSKVNNRYRATISCDGKRIHIGYFDTEEEAHTAYANKAQELFGDFAPHDRQIFYPGLTD